MFLSYCVAVAGTLGGFPFAAPQQSRSRGRSRAPGPVGPPAQLVPIPWIAWLLPFAILGAAGLALRDSPDARTWLVLAAGWAALLALAVIGLFGPRTAYEQYPDACRVTLRAVFGVMVVVALCCAYQAVAGQTGPLGLYPPIIIMPAFYLFALLIPLWTDSPVVWRIDPPREGWKMFAGFQWYYSNPAENALWVLLPYWVPQYSPNLGHHWGRVVMNTFIVLVAAVMALFLL